MNTDPKEMEVIKKRQRDCRHSFIKGAADTSAICPKCGLLQSEYEKRETNLINSGWAAHTGGLTP